MDIETLKSNYIRLKQVSDEISEAYDKVRDEYEKEIVAIEARFGKENAEIIQRHMQAHEELNKAETLLRSAIILEYRVRVSAAGDPSKVKKALAEGLSVQVRPKFAIRDEAAAIAWARANAPILIKETVDAKELEKIAKGKDLDFVEVTESISAVIKL